MSHHQLDLTSAGKARAKLSDAELQTFRDLGREINAGVDATIARYFASGDGWKQAGARFAEHSRQSRGGHRRKGRTQVAKRGINHRTSENLQRRGHKKTTSAMIKQVV